MTYIFAQKNSSITIFITASSFEEAEDELKATVKDIYGWRFLEEVE